MMHIIILGLHIQVGGGWHVNELKLLKTVEHTTCKCYGIKGL